MDFSETLALELHHNAAKSIRINEGNVKAKPLSRKTKVGKSFQYKFKKLSNRFIIWSIDNNVVQLVEHSTDYELIDNKLDITFDKSQILNLNIFENDQAVEFLIATSLSVIRFSLHHPLKLRQPNKETHQYSIFYDVCDLNEIKHSIGHYFDVTSVTSSNSTIDYSNNDALFNYALSNGSVYTMLVASSANIENITYFEMKETSLLSKIFSGFMSKQRSIEYSDTSVIDMTYVDISNSLHLITISKDNRLRIWNLKDRNCTVTEDLFPSVLEANNCNRSLSTINHNIIISAHKIKSFRSDTNLNDYLDTVVIYFHTTFGRDTLSNWVVVRIMDPYDRSSYNQPIQICSNIVDAGDNLNLVDYRIGYNLKTNDEIGVWSLTAQSNSQHSLHWVPLIEGRDTSRVSIRLQNPSDELELSVPDHQDPQETIIARVFSHHFSRTAVVNTINRNCDDGCQLPPNTNIDELKYRLVLAVEAKVEAKVSTYLEEDAEIDIIDMYRLQWHCIFQEIVQEHFCIMEPLGIVSASGTIGLHRSGTVSLVRAANGFEQILSGSANQLLAQFFDESSVLSGGTLVKYIHEMSILLQSIESWPTIQHQLFILGESPIEICRQLASASLNMSSSATTRFDSQPLLLEQVIDLLERLDLENVEIVTSGNDETCRLSSMSMGMLHYSACQVIRDRICASLALMTMLVSRSLNSPAGSTLPSLISRVTQLIKALVSVHWLLTVRQRASPELTDVQKAQLGSLQLLESRQDNQQDNTDILSILVLQRLQSKVTVHRQASYSWQAKINQEMSTIISYLYPNDEESFPLAEICRYFLSYNMPMELIDYLKMITVTEPSGWWAGDHCLANVMIAVAYLLLNKPLKAVEYIIDNVQRADMSSSLLPDVILSEDTRADIDSLSVLQSTLLIKMIDVIDSMDNSQAHVISLVKAGIKLIDDSMEANEKDTKYKSILLTILFKNLTEIKKYHEARTALIDNPDVDKQKDCLRQFIMVLCDNHELDKLVHFNYAHLNKEFVNIVASRARSSDLANVTFYQLLYSFHVGHGDMLAAATSMLDLALRLEADLRWKMNGNAPVDSGLATERLQGQMKAYLACLTTARLVVGEEPLFVVPKAVLTDDDLHVRRLGYEEVDETESMEVCLDEPEDHTEGTPKQVLTLTDVRRRYILVRCRLRLLRDASEHGLIRTAAMSAPMTLAALINTGLYSDAISICQNLNLDMSTTVTAIATRCAQISQNCLDRPILKEKENIIESLEEINADIDYAAFGSLHKLIWQLLSEVLHRYDPSPHGDLALKACSKLLSSGIRQLPAWLINLIVAKQSSSSLLRLYINNGCIEAAVDLSCTVLSSRIDELCLIREQLVFGCDRTSKPDQMSWFNYPIILHLLHLLDELKDHQSAAMSLYERLSDKFRTMTSLAQASTAPLAIE